MLMGMKMLHGDKAPFFRRDRHSDLAHPFSVKIMYPEVSVIVPVYNVETYLRCCIDSILSQTFTDFELLLVDDGSRDRSGNICDEYAARDKRIHVIHKENGGVCSARNRGLEDASGMWICLIDGDDWIEPAYLEELHHTAIKEQADVVIGGYRLAYADGTYSIRRPSVWDNNRLSSLNRYISNTQAGVFSWASLYRRSLYTDHGIKFPENISCREDFHLMVRLCYFATKVATDDMPLYNYRQHGASVLHNLNDNTLRSELQAYAEIIDFLGLHGATDDLHRSMAWLTLKACQDMTLDPMHYHEFQSYYPDKRNHIWSCPFIGMKIKTLSWLITHGHESTAATLANIRKKLRA